MNKLDKAINIVNKRLPKSYLYEIRQFSTIYSLFRFYAYNREKDYNKTINWYSEYFTNPETNTYIKTKYWRTHNIKKHRRKGYNICAIASEFGILIAYDNVKYNTVNELIFLIMHELGHIWLERHNRDIYNERWCDLFAIRWVRKMKKEGLL